MNVIVRVFSLCLFCLPALQASAGCYEPFADATAGGGTAYLPGAPLSGQCNVSGNLWYPVTNAAGAGMPGIVADSLSYPGLPPSSGNSLFIPSDVGVMGRMTLNFAATRGAVYFSFLLKVTDVTRLSETGTENNYFAAFGDNVGAQNATLLRAAARVLARRSGDGFKLGIGRNTSRPDDWVFDQTERPLNQVLFIVGSYNYTDRTANLWIDPPQSSFQSARPPHPTITARRGSDLNHNGIRSFVLGCRTNPPPACIVDELRIGRSWSFVTGGKDMEGQSRPAIQPVATHKPPGDFHLYITDPAVLARRPNILFILCDDLGYGDLGVLYQNSRAPGLPRETTPNLDRFAAEGMQLRQHYCPAPICAPSRASLLLGVHQGHANVRDQQFDKALEDNHTLGTVMQTAGYATAVIGKWGLGGDDEGGSIPAEWPAYPTRRGFDYFFGYERHGDGHDHYPKEAPYSNHGKQCYDGTQNITPMLDKCYTTDLFTARAKKWIVDHHAARPDQPFFLYLAFDTPHSVYELPTQAYPAGGGLNGGLQWLGQRGYMINTASGKIDSYVYPEYAHQGWPEVFQRFASGVRRIDDAVGDLKKLLADLGLETNTLVVFTSDNGPTIEDATHLKPHYAANFFDNFGPMDGIKRDTFEGGIRMPTLVRWPGLVPAGATNYSPSQFQDWMPTFSELAGLPAPARTDGVSLVPSLTGHGLQRPSTVYVEYFDPSQMPNYKEFEPSRRKRERNQMQVIGLRGYQGVRYDVKTRNDDFEIYDAVHDPKEITNLAPNPDFAVLQQEMKDRVLQMRRPNDTTPRPYDDDFVPPSRPVSATNGLVDYRVFAGNWPWVPDAAMLADGSAGRVAGLSLDVRPRETNYAVEFTGYISVPTNGNYTFFLDDDSGAVFRLHEATVIDDDFTHANAEASGSILLQAGLHAFRLTYLHRTGPGVLRLQYAAAGLPKQSVPLSAFYSDCAGCPVPQIVNNESGAPPRPENLLPATPRNRPLVAWNPRGQCTFLVHAGVVRFAVSGQWHGAADASTGWHPISGSMNDDGKQFRLASLFAGRVGGLRVFNREVAPNEMKALLGDDWQEHYFASGPNDWLTDEDGDGAILGRGPFIADSPVLQLVSLINACDGKVCLDFRIAAAHRSDYQVEASSDLNHWTPLTTKEIWTRPGPDLPGFDEVRVEANCPTVGQMPLYARVEVR